MKQHISPEQWKEISEKQRDIMRDGWIFDHPLEVFSLPTIGQMIEFLLEQDSGYFSIDTLPVNSPLDFEMGLIMVIDDKKTFRKPELADALWEAVKAVLNK